MEKIDAEFLRRMHNTIKAYAYYKPVYIPHTTATPRSEEEIICSALEKHLGRKPTDQDFLKTSRIYWEEKLRYTLAYAGIELGLVVPIWIGSNVAFTFVEKE